MMEFCSAAFERIECYIVTDLLLLIDCDVLNLVTMSSFFCEVVSFADSKGCLHF